MDKSEVLCACKDELTNHLYMIDEKTGKEGYMCLSCATFKEFDEDGDFDVMKHYEQMKRKNE